MYAAVPEADLLQGDVLASVEYHEFLGLTDEERKLGPTPITDRTVRWRVFSGYVALVSHSCDTTSENREKRARVVVAPLKVPDRGIVKKIQDELGSLDALDQIPEPGRPDYLNLFYYAPQEGVCSEPLMADFSNLLSLRREKLDVKQKVLELAPLVRDAFRAKLGFHFARP